MSTPLDWKQTLLLAGITLALGGCSSRDTLLNKPITGVEKESITGVELRTNEDLSAQGRRKHGIRRYRVTIKNLTTSQPLSPGAIVTHRQNVSWFEIGEAASEGIRLIAEDGDPSAAVSELEGRRGVHAVVATPRPIGCKDCPGPFHSELSMDIEAAKKTRRLSLAVMLICTNDGFTGLHGAKLPKGSKPVSYWVRGYDAGTEENDELLTSIVDPCGLIGPVHHDPDGLNNRTATKDVIRLHPGIQGTGDLDPNLHDWKNPVAKITIQRLPNGRGDDDEDDDDDDE